MTPLLLPEVHVNGQSVSGLHTVRRTLAMGAPPIQTLCSPESVDDFAIGRSMGDLLCPLGLLRPRLRVADRVVVRIGTSALVCRRPVGVRKSAGLDPLVPDLHPLIRCHRWGADLAIRTSRRPRFASRALLDVERLAIASALAQDVLRPQDLMLGFIILPHGSLVPFVLIELRVLGCGLAEYDIFLLREHEAAQQRPPVLGISGRTDLCTFWMSV